MNQDPTKTAGSFAQHFIAWLASELSRAKPPAWIEHWYLYTPSEQFDASRLDEIPDDQVYGIKAVVKTIDAGLIFYWDLLEQSVIVKDESSMRTIIESKTCRFYEHSIFDLRVQAALHQAVKFALNHKQ